MADQPQRRNLTHFDRLGPLLLKNAAAGNPEELLSPTEVAEMLGVNTQFLDHQRHFGGDDAIEFIRLSRSRIRYTRKAVVEWLAKRVHRSTAEYSSSRKISQRPR